jgi:hypothetical protein
MTIDPLGPWYSSRHTVNATQDMIDRDGTQSAARTIHDGGALQHRGSHVGDA